MAGNVIEYISPPVTSLVNNVTINTLSPECIGPEMMGLDDGLASAVWTANRLIFLPLVTVQPVLVAQFFWINGSAVSGNTDVGIYDFAGTTKLGSSGSIANSGTTTLQTVDVADFTLPAHARFWLALGCDNATQAYWRANLVAQGLSLIGVKEQLSGWSSGLPSSIALGTPTVAVLPMFGFTGRSVI